MTNDSDIGCALFALGRFIDYRLGEGFPDDEDLLLFKQAYFNLMDRRMGLEPRDVRALQALEVAASPELEEAINQVNKVNPRKEFFNVSVKEIREVIEALGIQAHWTMKAEAAEYRETLAIGKEVVAA